MLKFKINYALQGDRANRPPVTAEDMRGLLIEMAEIIQEQENELNQIKN